MEDLKLKNKIDAYIDAHQADYVVFFLRSRPCRHRRETKQKKQPLSSRR